MDVFRDGMPPLAAERFREGDDARRPALQLVTPTETENAGARACTCGGVDVPAVGRAHLASCPVAFSRISPDQGCSGRGAGTAASSSAARAGEGSVSAEGEAAGDGSAPARPAPADRPSTGAIAADGAAANPTDLRGCGAAAAKLLAAELAAERERLLIALVYSARELAQKRLMPISRSFFRPEMTMCLDCGRRAERHADDCAAGRVLETLRQLADNAGQMAIAQMGGAR